MSVDRMIYTIKLIYFIGHIFNRLYIMNDSDYKNKFIKKYYTIIVSEYSVVLLNSKYHVVITGALPAYISEVSFR